MSEFSRIVQLAQLSDWRAMKSSFVLSFALVFGFACAFSACASPPPEQAFNKIANASIHRIALLKVPETNLRVINMGSAFGGFGLIGAALAESDEDSKSQAFAA